MCDLQWLLRDALLIRTCEFVQTLLTKTRIMLTEKSSRVFPKLPVCYGRSMSVCVVMYGLHRTFSQIIFL